MTRAQILARRISALEHRGAPVVRARTRDDDGFLVTEIRNVQTGKVFIVPCEAASVAQWIEDAAPGAALSAARAAAAAADQRAKAEQRKLTLVKG